MQSLLDQVVEADAREVLRAAAAAHVSGLSGRPPVMPVGAMSPVTSTMEAGDGSVPLRQQSPGSGELVSTAVAGAVVPAAANDAVGTVDANAAVERHRARAERPRLPRASEEQFAARRAALPPQLPPPPPPPPSMATWQPLPLAFDAEAFVSSAARGRLNPLPGSQDHLPATYAVARGFVSEAEAAALHAFFASPSNPHIERTSLAGDELAAGQAPDPGEALVRQLYGNPQPFRDAFPDVWARLLALKDALGAACGVDADELARVSFAQDIRHITYGPGEECPWHRDDPISHFNTIVMLARPGDDFTGGELRLHPGPLPGRDADDAPGVRAPKLRHGDAVIYSTPKVDHCVSATLSGTRTICLVELRREEAAERREGPR